VAEDGGADGTRKKTDGIGRKCGMELSEATLVGKKSLLKTSAVAVA
jgi:hypothetical protein